MIQIIQITVLFVTNAEYGGRCHLASATIRFLVRLMLFGRILCLVQGLHLYGNIQFRALFHHYGYQLPECGVFAHNIRLRMSPKAIIRRIKEFDEF